MLDSEDSSLIETLQLRLLESTPDLLAIASKEGRFLWLSASWTRTLGWSRDELMAEPFLEFVVEADLHYIRHLFHVRKDGQLTKVVPSEFGPFPVTDEDTR